MKTFLLYLWQLPQNLIGFIMSRFAKESLNITCNDKKSVKIFFTKNVFNCGVSLGNYILLDYDSYYEGVLHGYPGYIKTVNHEHGHQIQSRYLGWFYLFTIGICSAGGNLFDRLFHKNWSINKRNFWYYKKLPWELWADTLGKVER